MNITCPVCTRHQKWEGFADGSHVRTPYVQVKVGFVVIYIYILRDWFGCEVHCFPLLTSDVKVVKGFYELLRKEYDTKLLQTQDTNFYGLPEAFTAIKKRDCTVVPLIWKPFTTELPNLQVLQDLPHSLFPSVPAQVAADQTAISHSHWLNTPTGNVFNSPYKTIKVGDLFSRYLSCVVSV